jgi:protein SCO1/2
VHRLTFLLTALAAAVITACGGAALLDGTAASERSSDAPGYAQRAAAQLQLEALPTRGAPEELWGRELPLPLPLPDFSLKTAEGTAFDYTRDADAPLTLVYFGYTSCPDVCPTHLAAISAAMDELTPSQRELVDVLFVTVDPTVDTPARLRSYLASFDPQIIGLTGRQQQVNRALAGLGLPPTAVGADAQSPPEHPSAVIGFTPDDGGFVAWPFGTAPGIYAHDLSLLTNRNRQTPT